MNADANARAGRRIDVAAVFLVSRLQAAERWISVVEIDALHARREKRRDRVLGRSGTPRSDLVAECPVDGFEKELERIARTSHRDCLLFGARGDYELGLKRAKVLAAGVHPRADSQWLSGDDTSGTGENLHGDRMRKELQPRGFEGTVERGQTRDDRNGQHSDTGGGDQPGPSQLIAGHQVRWGNPFESARCRRDDQ